MARDGRPAAANTHTGGVAAGRPLLNPILAVLPLQLLAYQLSLARGYDPDFPCSLSRTLTVD